MIMTPEPRQITPRWRLTFILVLLASCTGDGANDEQPAGGAGGVPGGAGDPACWSSPASKLFDHAVCLCDGLDDLGAMTIQPGPGEAAADVGVNGLVRLTNGTQVGGSVAAYGGLQAVGNLEVRDAASSAADVAVAGRLDVGKDLSVGGNLSGLGWVQVGGALRVAGSDSVLGHKGAASVGAYAAPAGPPCACGAGQVLDVAAAVAKAKAASDNGLKNLPTSLSDLGDSELKLSSGKYFFDHVGQVGKMVITVEGTVALYLDGDLDSVGAEWITLKPGATLDLYVSGSVRSVGHLALGDAAQPAAFRLYVGGSQPLLVGVGNAELLGAVYAPTAVISYVGRTVVRGGLFGKTLQSAGYLELSYQRPAPTLPSQQLCPPKGTPAAPTNPKAGALPDPDAIYAD